MNKIPRLITRAVAAAGAAGVVVLGAALPASAAAASNAYAVKANLLSGLVNVAPTPVSTFPEGGKKSTVGVNLGLLGNVRVLNSDAEGNVTAGTSSAHASVAKVNLLLGQLLSSSQAKVSPAALAQVKDRVAAITADAVTASCSANGGTLSGDVHLANARIGNSTVDVSPTKNSGISVGGILSVKLNEQNVSDGTLSVNAIHIKLLSGAGGDVIIGHAQCGPNAPENGVPLMSKPALGGFGVLSVAVIGGFLFYRRRNSASAA